MLSKESCAAVLNAGSNLRVSGGLPTDALVELARIARQRGVRLEIKCGLSPDSMVEIAEAGGESCSSSGTTTSLMSPPRAAAPRLW
jgi:hypothetical protein